MQQAAGRCASLPPEAFFLGEDADIFCLYYPPQGQDKQRDLLVVPPFAEEMNRSRRMMALFAQQASVAGYGVLQLDLYGTGDSGGEFVDARWPLWLNNLQQGADWLRARGRAAPVILAIRFGALLAAAWLASQPHAASQLIFWQAVANGDNLLRQFLRLRLAANMLDAQSEKASMKDLQASFANGVPVEIAGYCLHPQLYQAIAEQKLLAQLSAIQLPIHWFELSHEPERGVMPASKLLIDKLLEQGRTLDVNCVQGDAFWSLPEITTAPALISSSLAVLNHA